MKIYLYWLFPITLATLPFTKSVKAEEISTKATDLTDSNPTLFAQSSDSGFTPSSPTTIPSTPLYKSGDINPDLPASNYSYVTTSGGFGIQHDVDLKPLNGNNPTKATFNTGFSLSGTIAGYQFKNFRGELEFNSRFLSARELIRANGNKLSIFGNLTVITVLINGYYDFPTGSKFRPYIGGGLGLNFNTGNVDGIVDISGTSFAYQGKTGIQYEITPKGNIFAEVKYTVAQGYRLKDRVLGDDVELGNISSVGLNIGYRQGF
ncbi:hypothetical protein B7O87_03010 [Cylindrospermopsis raciborskii CENA303]|uniref:Msp4/OMP-like domain-containing protein n=1 Tax=Cylindrospermopsis raciborskii CENA303 TaxID=1170769 RepID=A0A1X4GB64_9CYAN|nr:P44/Msp2 family outer membrane protein [Cylindrospermopsis raciborskii]OSO94421.1 hypothetical protein B7O87_03010 [Cylindrospermopsis raciborskii CENA303]